MKKIALFVLIAVLVYLTAVPALAGGDQHHGDKGQGYVIQHQVNK